MRRFEGKNNKDWNVSSKERKGKTLYYHCQKKELVNYTIVLNYYRFCAFVTLLL